MDTASWEAVENWFAKVEMAVPSSSKWNILMYQNMNNQMNSLADSDSFCPFLLGALRVGTGKPRNKTHVVVIHYEASHSLGEIASIVSFQVLELDKAWSLHSSTWFAQQDDRRNYFDFENSPRLQKERLSEPRTSMMLVLFVQLKRNVSFAYPVFGPISILSKGKPLQVKYCDDKAAKHFRVLQNTRLPKVKNPPLEG